jgi:AbiU2
LIRHFLIELCKFIDEDEEKSLHDWLSKALENSKSIKATKYDNDLGKHLIISPGTYRVILNREIEKLQSHSKTIKNLNARRDKVLAHTDASFFNNPKELYQKYPLMTNDITELMDSISKILSNQGVYMGKGFMDTTTVHTTHNLNRIMQFVRVFERAQKDDDLKKRGIYIMNYKWDNYKKYNKKSFQ